MKLHPVTLAYVFNNEMMMFLMQALNGELVDIWALSDNNTDGTFKEVSNPDYHKYVYRNVTGYVTTFYFDDVDLGIPAKITFGATEQHTLDFRHYMIDGVLRVVVSSRGETDIIYNFDESGRLIGGQTSVEVYEHKLPYGDYLPREIKYVRRLDGTEEPGDYPCSIQNSMNCMGFYNSDKIEVQFDDNEEFVNRLVYKPNGKIKYTIDVEALRASI